MATTDQKPILLHLGADIKWNHELYGELQSLFQIARSHSMDRELFKDALRTNKFGDFVAMYRPFWSTGGEMGNWDEELMYVTDSLTADLLTSPALSCPTAANSSPAPAPDLTGSTPKD
jgi:hypothetical protein